MSSDVLIEQEDLCIFIDTLAMATSSEKLKAAALTKMNIIYRDAVCVLILDRCVEAYRYDVLNDCEGFMRLLTSRWIGRLWTFSETSVAQKLWVKFADRVVDLDHFTRTARDLLTDLNKHSILALGWLGHQYSLRNGWLFPESKAVYQHPLATVSRNVSLRQCSVASDEAICLGICVEFRHRQDHRQCL